MLKFLALQGTPYIYIYIYMIYNISRLRVKDQTKQSITLNKMPFLYKFCFNKVLCMMWQKYLTHWAPVCFYSKMPRNEKYVSCSSATLYDGSYVEALFSFEICLSYATPITKRSKNHIQTQCFVLWISCKIHVHYHETIILHLHSVDLLRSLVSQSTKKYEWCKVVSHLIKQ
jgi:hypothetical protein